MKLSRKRKQQASPEIDLNAYDSSYRLLKESRESWEHIVSDKLVYFIDSAPINFNSFQGVAKRYADADSWIEFHLVLHAEREIHYAIIVESYQVAWNRVGQFKVNNGTMNGNSPMLVDIAQFVEFPQQIGLNAYSVPSVIRLKRIDDCDCRRWHISEVLLKPTGSTFIPFVKDGELSSIGVRPLAVSSQCPNQLVETRTKAEENVSCDYRQVDGGVDQLNFDLILASFNVVLTPEGARLRLQEFRPLSIKSIKMFLRPSGFQIGVSEAHHVDCQSILKSL